MKKTLVSLAAASLIVTSAVAADKGIDIVTTGQAVVYYETQTNNGKDDADLFNQKGSQANVGLQLNLDADLKNNFTFGSQLSYLGTAGLENNLVSGTKQGVTSQGNTESELALTKIFVAKKIANTTVKIGRQELPKTLSPLAFSEGWNVFKNTFDAVLAVNTDIPDTTVVGAYVTAANTTNGAAGGINTMNNITGNAAGTAGGAYMLTAQTKAIPMTTLTVTYYDVSDMTTDDAGNQTNGLTAVWADAAVAGKELPMGLKFGLQAGQISPENIKTTGANEYANTTAFGARIGLAPIDALTLCLAYTSVDGDKNKKNLAVKNLGTGVKTPLFTQMVYNQNAIALDANTYMVKAAYNTGDYGTVIAQYGMTTAGDNNLQGKDADYNEFDLIYKVKAAGVEYFAAYLYRTIDDKTTTGMQHANAPLQSNGKFATEENRIRVWARYAF